MKTITLTVLGMDCAACASTLERSMRWQKGVQHAVVNYTAGTMELTYDDAALTLEDVVLYVKKAGYRVPVEEADLALPKGADTEAVKNALRSVYGVCGVEDRPDRKIMVTFRPVGVDSHALLDAVRSAGAEAEVTDFRAGEARLNRLSGTVSFSRIGQRPEERHSVCVRIRIALTEEFCGVVGADSM